MQIPVYFDVGINVTYLEKKYYELEKFEFVSQRIGPRINDFKPKLNR
jgi:hypothetical protein